jgi:hypothetical protein
MVLPKIQSEELQEVQNKQDNIKMGLNMVGQCRLGSFGSGKGPV